MGSSNMDYVLVYLAAPVIAAFLLGLIVGGLVGVVIGRRAK